MARIVSITAGTVTVAAALLETPTAAAVWDALPLSGTAERWGDEIYFTVPVSVDLEASAAETVSAGDLGYWPTGRACCIFFGPTPASRPGEIRPASAVNVFGSVLGDASALGAVAAGSAITFGKQA